MTPEEFESGKKDIPITDLPEYAQKYVATLYARILNLQKQVEAYEEYVCVLNDELNDTVGMASIHGWRSRNVERGKECRDKLSQLGVTKYDKSNGNN